ncbi:hypothetical protein HPB58_12985 [Priestia filamentosa]|uniref:hypothetical protein n=1 Tax=Priestia filamentosa TaxID=1402861 RepID=UPI001FB34855|nr:hypothetical protein [Priestia filamentosa]UOE58272.1 hypothetical protein HPB58_12985 [Priestia filamentosa]
MNICEVLDSLIDNELDACNTINMVPSENYASAISRIPLILDVYNRYFFNVNQEKDSWNFRGAQKVSSLESHLAVPLLKEMGKARYVNLRPLSGLNCMALILNALSGGPNSNIMLVSPDQGGHYATKDLAESFGLNVSFITGHDAHTIDFDDMIYKLKCQKIKLIYIDQSNCLFPIDIEKLTKVVREVSPETIIHVDVSHWMGLVLGEAMENPLEQGADSFGGSTHKTFPGPQKAIFCTNRKDLANLVQEKQYFMLSSHHFGNVLSLALSLMEFKEKDGREYAKNIVENSKRLATTLKKFGFDVKGHSRGFTCGHQIWVSTNNVGIDSFITSEKLSRIGIKVNVFDELPDAKESILRLGVNEITRFGATLSDMDELAAIMYDCIYENSSIKHLQKRVSSLRQRYKNAYTYDLTNPEIQTRIEKLLKVVFPSLNLNSRILAPF